MTRLVTDIDQHPDGVLLKSIKRPKHMLPGLPLVATIEVACPDLTDRVVLAARSPLMASKVSYDHAMPAFWCAVEAEKDDGQHVNMELRTATVDFKGGSVSIDNHQKRRRRDPKMQITFPVLVNSKPLKEGDVLVFANGTQFAISNPADEQAVSEFSTLSILFCPCLFIRVSDPIRIRM